jgi:class 3 adenylate cyclase
LFGVGGELGRAAQNALRAAGAIESVMTDLNGRFERSSSDRVAFFVGIHADYAAVGEVGPSETVTTLAIGAAPDVAKQLLAAAAAHDVPFAISERVHSEAGLVPAFSARIEIAPTDAGSPIVVAFLAKAAPVPLRTWTIHGEQTRRSTLRRLWSGR